MLALCSVALLCVASDLRCVAQRSMSHGGGRGVEACETGALGGFCEAGDGLVHEFGIWWDGMGFKVWVGYM